MSFMGEAPGKTEPSPLHHLSRLDKCLLARLDANIALEQFASDRLRLRAQVGRFASEARPIDAVLLRLLVLSAHCPLGGICRNTEQPEIPRKFRPPMAQRCLLDV